MSGASWMETTLRKHAAAKRLSAFLDLRDRQALRKTSRIMSGELGYVAPGLKRQYLERLVGAGNVSDNMLQRVNVVVVDYGAPFRVRIEIADDALEDAVLLGLGRNGAVRSANHATFVLPGSEPAPGVVYVYDDHRVLAIDKKGKNPYAYIGKKPIFDDDGNVSDAFAKFAQKYGIECATTIDGLVGRLPTFPRVAWMTTGAGAPVACNVGPGNIVDNLLAGERARLLPDTLGDRYGVAAPEANAAVQGVMGQLAPDVRRILEPPVLDDGAGPRLNPDFVRQWTLASQRARSNDRTGWIPKIPGDPPRDMWFGTWPEAAGYAARAAPQATWVVDVVPPTTPI